MSTIRVQLPHHLRTLAGIGHEIELAVEAAPTIQTLIDTLEARYPALRGTIRDQVTLQRRPFLRFFACEEDLSLLPPNFLLPEAVLTGKEPFLIIAAIAGG